MVLEISVSLASAPLMSLQVNNQLSFGLAYDQALTLHLLQLTHFQ